MDGEGTAAPEAASGGEATEAGGLENFEDMLSQQDSFDTTEGADTEATPDAPEADAEDAMDAAEADSEADVDDAPDDVDSDEETEAAPIHGMKPEDILSAIEQGTIPDELMDVLTITQTIDGVEVPVTLTEAKKGGMRLADYSRRNNELRSKEQAHSEAVDNFVTMIEGWKNPSAESRKQTLQMLENWIGDDVVLELARDVADREVRLDALGPQGREEAVARRKAERELLKERQAREAAERASKSRADTDGQQSFQKTYEGLRDTAFAKHKLHKNPHIESMFRANLAGVWVDRSVPLSAAHADEAALATIEELAKIREEIAASEATQQKAQAGAKRQAAKLPPKAASRGGGGGKRSGKPRRGGLENFEELLGL